MDRGLLLVRLTVRVYNDQIPRTHKHMLGSREENSVVHIIIMQIPKQSRVTPSTNTALYRRLMEISLKILILSGDDDDDDDDAMLSLLVGKLDRQIDWLEFLRFVLSKCCMYIVLIGSI